MKKYIIKANVLPLEIFLDKANDLLAHSDSDWLTDSGIELYRSTTVTKDGDILVSFYPTDDFMNLVARKVDEFGIESRYGI